MADIPDESELIWPATWQGLKQQIIYLAQFGNSVQVIHGAPGAGKSTFFQHLLTRGFSSSAVGINAAQGAGFDAFLRSALEQLGLRPDQTASRGELIAALRGFVQTLHRERSRTVLLIDDAHTFSDPELGALLSLQQGHEDAGVGLHMVMFAEPGFAARLDSLGLLDVTVHDAPLPPLSLAETHQLLRRLTPRLGLPQDVTEPAQQLWQQSQGLPGRLVELAEQLRPQPAKEKALSLRGLPIGHFAALIVLSGVLIWAFLVRSPSQPPQTEARTQPLPIPRVTTAPYIELESPKPQELAANPVSLPIQEEVPAQSPDIRPSASTEAAESGANFDDQTAADTVKPQTEPAPPAPEPQPVALREQPQRPAASMDPGTLSSDEQALLRLPASGFALQLMAASTAEALNTFMAQQPNRKNLRMYHSTRNGKALYIAVEGFYADKASAQAAVVNLPEQQRRMGPWPKPLEQIHREIRSNRPK